MIQVYGSFTDHGSFSNITRAICKALVHGRLQIGAWEIASMSPTYTGARVPVMHNSHAPVGIAVAYPIAGLGWLKGHEKRVLVTVCESDRLPIEWVKSCNQATDVVVPSQWCKEVFARSGVSVPIHVVRHGVHETRRIDTDPGKPEPAEVRLLHVSGALSFPKRKGTPQLLIALSRLVKEYQGLVLYLKTRPMPHLEDALAQLGLTGHVRVIKRQDLAPEEMTCLLRQVDGVVQPSRGEGFGIVPLEARCLGTPVVMTSATGHAEHFADGFDTRIETGAASRLETQGNDLGWCPEVSPEAIEAALRQFLEDQAHRKQLARIWAANHAREWTWPEVLRPLVSLVKPFTRTGRVVAGAEASLRGL